MKLALLAAALSLVGGCCNLTTSYEAKYQREETRVRSGLHVGMSAAEAKGFLLREGLRITQQTPSMITARYDIQWCAEIMGTRYILVQLSLDASGHIQSFDVRRGTDAV